MSKPSILVVEDEFVVAFELKGALEGMGFTVCGMVSSGVAAIETAEREKPDCVLMDVSLKGEMDGIQAARRISTGLGIRTAFLSGFPAEEMMTRAADVEPIGFFVKPLEYGRLEKELRKFFLSRAAEIN